MREIKFRFYSKDAKQYVPIELIDLKGDFFTVRYLGQNHHIDNIKQIEQYTGLKDKNGKEIYEGDILFHANGSYFMRVEWDEKQATFVLLRDKWAFRHYFYESTNPEYCEVIGNIHENPELLNE